MNRIIVIPALVFTLLTACNKATDCKATIQCVNENGEPVKNTNVYLFALVKNPETMATYTADVKASGTTDDRGEVSFVFKLPAIFDIQATAGDGNNVITGKSIVKLEEGQSVGKSVTLK